MSHILILGITLCYLFVGLKAQGQFSIFGKIIGLQVKCNIYLMQFSTGDTVGKASVDKEEFKICGKVPNGTEYYYFKLDSIHGQGRSESFLLENTQMQILSDVKSWPKINLSGSKSHDVYNNAKKIWNETEIAIENLDHNRLKWNVGSGGSLPFEELRKQDSIYVLQRNKLLENRIISIRKLIVENLNSPYVPDLICQLKGVFSANEKLNLYESLSDVVKHSYFGKKLFEQIEKEKEWMKVSAGSLIPDLRLLKTDGQAVFIRDIISKSKYTLIDFWASWCVVCRREIPNLKLVYKRFQERGLGIIGVAVSDNVEEWKNALKLDRAPWLQLFDNDRSVSNAFNLDGIPAYVLVDSKGTIISLDCPGSLIKPFGPPIRGSKLEPTLAELLK